MPAPDTTPDPATEALEEIRETARKRDEALEWVARATADDGELDAATGAFEVVNDKLAARAVRLLAAVEAVLKEHGPDRADAAWCGGCGFSFPCATIQAITRELTGGTDGR